MKPQLLTLALDTPLEDLLGLPNGVEIAYSLRSELAHYRPTQLHDILAAIDALIATEQQTFRSIPGIDDEEIQSAREQNRDIDWLDDAIRFQPLPLLKGGITVGAQALYRVLALYKLGAVIDATQGRDNTQFSRTVVEDILEATKAMALAKPPTETWEQSLSQVWQEGLKPDPDEEDIIAKARSEAAQSAANIRHLPNRIAREKALKLYFEDTFPSVDYASMVIGEQVFKAPRTVANWIAEAKKKSRARSGNTD